VSTQETTDNNQSKEPQKGSAKTGCIGCMALLVIPIIALFVFGIFSDNPKEDISNNDGKMVESQSKPVNATEKVSALLGDNKEQFEKAYGKDENKGGALSAYGSKTILVMYSDDKAYNITMSISQPVPAIAAIEGARKFRPADAVKIKEYNVEQGKDVILYKSEELAKKFDSSKFIKGNPGEFIEIYKYDNRGVYAVIFGLGNNP
jgi:hypothetical protein